MSKTVVYIAGPYSGGDVGLNVRNMIVAADAVAMAGGLPVVPLLSHFWHVVAPHSYDFWMEMGLEWVRRSDVVLRIPGESPGADKECELARNLGTHIYYAHSGEMQELLRLLRKAEDGEGNRIREIAY